MPDHSQRIDEFTKEVAQMNLPDNRSSRDRLFLIAGASLMGLGIVVTVLAYFIGHGTTNPLQQRDAIVIALIGLTLAVVGAALFVRYSLAQFLRFWLARSSWEQTTQTDRLIDALRTDR